MRTSRRRTASTKGPRGSRREHQLALCCEFKRVKLTEDAREITRGSVASKALLFDHPPEGHKKEKSKARCRLYRKHAVMILPRWERSLGRASRLRDARHVFFISANSLYVFRFVQPIGSLYRVCGLIDVLPRSTGTHTLVVGFSYVVPLKCMSDHHIIPCSRSRRHYHLFSIMSLMLDTSSSSF